jgi:hypothetical protein
VRASSIASGSDNCAPAPRSRSSASPVNSRRRAAASSSRSRCSVWPRATSSARSRASVKPAAQQRSGTGGPIHYARADLRSRQCAGNAGDIHVQLRVARNVQPFARVPQSVVVFADRHQIGARIGEKQCQERRFVRPLPYYGKASLWVALAQRHNNDTFYYGSEANLQIRMVNGSTGHTLSIVQPVNVESMQFTWGNYW